MKPVDDLIRFVVGPDGVVPDLKRKLPGRGIWVTADPSGAGGGRDAQGVRARLQARRPRRAGPGGPDRAAAGPRRARCAGHRRQGRAGGGRLRQGRGGARPRARSWPCCMPPTPAAGRGRKARRRAAPAAGRRAGSPSITAFTSAQLDLALGRSNVVHAALLAGPASDTFLARFARLERFRTGEPDGKAVKAATAEADRNWN